MSSVVMKFKISYLLVIIFGGTWHLGHPTCVLESDFGFILNCAFKKSGLFRVRNLGGIKAHVGLGFSLGDELGFKESLNTLEANRRRSVQGSSNLQALLSQNSNNGMRSQSVVQAASLLHTSTIPPFRPIPPAPERPSFNSNIKLSNHTRNVIATPALKGTFPKTLSNSATKTPAIDQFDNLDNNPALTVVVPISNRRKLTDKLSSTNFALRTLPSSNNDINAVLPQSTVNSIKLLAAATNISAEALEAAFMKQKLEKQASLTATSAASIPNNYISTPAPTKNTSQNKVMNAPREYYPVGYDKNYDDNFVSRVDLPETSFYCGDQKHFPGLYADEDLGCMVFHVCALTDDGLIMKSFLCPESTLFDQTILKCNWWFYVECKNSKKLYDSNIPVSKSYQLMKALTFFSSYKSDNPVQKNKQED